MAAADTTTLRNIYASFNIMMSDEDHKKFGRLAICALIDVLNCLIETLI